MKNVAKYNTYKGVSTVLTVGAPIATLACYGDFFVQRSETTVSAAAVFAILIAMLFAKDKLAENFKCPSAFIVSCIGLVFVTLVENILYPIKMVCRVTILTSGIDELTFKRMCKDIGIELPKLYKDYMHCGFICTSTDNLVEKAKKRKEQEKDDEQDN